jgi:hypothetical protein
MHGANTVQKSGVRRSWKYQGQNIILANEAKPLK